MGHVTDARSGRIRGLIRKGPRITAARRISGTPEPTHAMATARPAFATIAFRVALGRMAVPVFFSHGW